MFRSALMLTERSQPAAHSLNNAGISNQYTLAGDCSNRAIVSLIEPREHVSHVPSVHSVIVGGPVVIVSNQSWCRLLSRDRHAACHQSLELV